MTGYRRQNEWGINYYISNLKHGELIISVLELPVACGVNKSLNLKTIFPRSGQQIAPFLPATCRPATFDLTT
jgi:hypothetical protein